MSKSFDKPKRFWYNGPDGFYENAFISQKLYEQFPLQSQRNLL